MFEICVGYHFFYHKDPYRIKFSRFYLLWGVRYQHLCDFSHFQNVTITSLLRQMCEFFPRLEVVRARPKISHMPKISLGGIPVSSINSEHINIYTHTLIAF